MRAFYRNIAISLVFLGVGAFGSAELSAQSENTAKEEKPFWETEKTPAKLVKRYERRLPFFKVIDTNNDWILSDEEIQKAIIEEFKKYDVDSDGIFDEKELKAHRKDFEDNRKAVYGSVVDKRLKRYDQRMKQLDDNEDRILKWEEFYEFTRLRYHRMDNNKDNEIEYREFRTIDDKIAPGGGVKPNKIEVPNYK